MVVVIQTIPILIFIDFYFYFEQNNIPSFTIWNVLLLPESITVFIYLASTNVACQARSGSGCDSNNITCMIGMGKELLKARTISS